MITLNNESGRISCYVFVCLFTCILPLLPYSLASGGWCVCIISRGLVSSGFWLGSDEGRGALDRDWRGGLAGKLRSKYLGCWVPPSVDAPLTEDLSHSQDSAGLFPGTGTSPLPIPLGLDTGSYTVSWGFSTASSHFVICFFVNKSSLEYPQWSVPTAL